MDTREQLTKAFTQFPGIGPRQARRFVYYCLTRGPSFTDGLARTLSKLNDNIARCEVTHYHFQKETAEQTKSNIARDPDRDRSKLLIVETDMDLEAVESTGEYDGMYFVLGSQGSLTDENLEKRLHLSDLEKIIKKYYKDTLKEVIIATSVTPEGERVRETVSHKLENLSDELNFSVSTLGRGLSTGTELEYIDDHTLRHALKGRS